MDTNMFNKILLHIGNNLLEGNVEQIAFNYKEIIGVYQCEKIKTPTELFSTLQNHKVLRENNYGDFIKLLKDIGRNDLAVYFGEAMTGLMGQEESVKMKIVVEKIDTEKFKKILQHIGKNLTHENVDRIKFNYQDIIGVNECEKIKTPTQLFSTLQKCKVLEKNNYVDFINLLENIGRKDLAEGFVVKKLECNKFNEILRHIGKNMSACNIEKILFNYQEAIGIFKCEEIKNPFQLFITLQSCGVLRDDNYGDFINLLEQIGRKDLAEYFESQTATSSQQSLILQGTENIVQDETEAASTSQHPFDKQSKLFALSNGTIQSFSKLNVSENSKENFTLVTKQQFEEISLQVTDKLLLEMLDKRIRFIEDNVNGLNTWQVYIDTSLTITDVFNKAETLKKYESLKNNNKEVYEYATTFNWALRCLLEGYIMINTGLIEPKSDPYTGVSGIISNVFSAVSKEVSDRDVSQLLLIVGGIIRILNGVYKQYFKIKSYRMAKKIADSISNNIHGDLKLAIANSAIDIAILKEPIINEPAEKKVTLMGKLEEWFTKKLEKVLSKITKVNGVPESRIRQMVMQDIALFILNGIISYNDKLVEDSDDTNKISQKIIDRFKSGVTDAPFAKLEDNIDHQVV